MLGSMSINVEDLTSWRRNDDEIAMNISTDESTAVAATAAAAARTCAGTVSLAEAQNEAFAKSPSRGELKWRRMDPTLDAAVAPLLKKPIVPFHKTEKAKAHKSAIYYSECFLNGVTPNDADRAALHVDTQYKKWWIKSSYNDDDQHQQQQQQRPSHNNRLHPAKNLVSSAVSTTTDASSKRKYIQVVSDESHYSHQGEVASPKRRRRRGNVRDVIDDVTFAVHRQKHHKHSKNEATSTAARILPEDDEHEPFTIQIIPNLPSVNAQQIKGIRDEILDTLRHNGGVLEDPMLKTGLSILESYYLSSDLDARRSSFPYDIDGTWLTLSRPTYTECQGKNRSDEYQYSLGRMSFDMFRPTNLKCSIQGIFNTVQLLDASKGELPFSMPRTIRKELGKSLVAGSVKGLRTYNIIVAFTIEPNQTRAGRPVPKGSTEEDVIQKPIRGIMTNYGYLLPDPHVANRLSVWFTGGSLEVNDDDQDLDEWKKIFGDKAPSRDLGEFARVLAAKVLLGASISDQMEDDGTLSYFLKRPIGGHGSAFCDVLYMDDKLRVMRGHNGSIFAFSKVQD